MHPDPVLGEIVQFLTIDCQCHTVLLYGSRARGQATASSDYDLAGVRSQGPNLRIARQVEGHDWDLFLYQESDLRRFGDQQRAWKDALLLVDRHGYGARLMRRLKRFLATPPASAPPDEIAACKAWSLKQLVRCGVGDVHGDFRRLELAVAALSDYFRLRELPYPGPKAALQWLKENDAACYGCFQDVYRDPLNRRSLEGLVARVYEVVVNNP